VLNAINTEAVIRDGGAMGRFSGEIHEGVAWWLGACLVVTHKATRIAVAHDGHPTIAEFAHRFCHGAVNAQHYACNVKYLSHQTEERLVHTLKSHHGIPGAWLSTSGPDGAPTIRITLYNGQGLAVDDTNGLAEIRRMIAEDRVPIRVNEQAKGTIEPGHHNLPEREGLS
jgi:hypothetical protein